MSTPNTATAPPSTSAPASEGHHLRFHVGSVHLAPAFGGDWFGVRAERFARFFGTPTFLIAQSVLVLVWISLNAAGVVAFDLYPFILLNLAFSLQAAYAAPLILLAQTRQADRDKAAAENDAQHREALARDALHSQKDSHAQLELLVTLVNRNTELTELTHKLSLQIDGLTRQIHEHVTGQPSPPPHKP
jgi:uncharacterized membrane protein